MDVEDNCPAAANGPSAGSNDQVDSDQDGIGDAGECGDFDGDGRVNTADARLVQRLAVGQLSKATLRCAERPGGGD